MNDPLITTQQLLQQIPYSIHGIYALVRNKRLPVIKLGGRLLFRQSAIDRLLRELEQPAEPAGATKG
jgi:predicted DNA-binding transcriptional regulator AlpA